MDIVGTTASIAQLASLAKCIVTNLYQYYESVRKAPKHAGELRQELGTISDLLGDIEETLTNPTNQSFKPSDSLKTAILEFRKMLSEMDNRVNKSQTKGIKRLKWPFTQDENERYLDRMTRYKGTFTVAIGIKNA